jgi:hypothetical protein
MELILSLLMLVIIVFLILWALALADKNTQLEWKYERSQAKNAELRDLLEDYQVTCNTILNRLISARGAGYAALKRELDELASFNQVQNDAMQSASNPALRAEN